jgi:hypothetical protein
MNTKQFKLLILESPFENWGNPLVESIFSKMVTLKKKGYGGCYANGVLPIDTTDFLSTHVLLCEIERDGNFTPVMGYKTITLQKCRQYNLNFPGLSLVQNAKMPVHSEVVQSIIERCEKEQRSLAYLGSWTMNPAYRHRQLLKKELKEAFMAFYRMVYREQNVAEVLIGGTLRFKTEKLFSDLGHRPLSLDGQPLSPIHVAHLVKEPVLVMHSADFNETSLEAEKKWHGVWEDRMIIENENLQIAINRVA